MTTSYWPPEVIASFTTFVPTTGQTVVAVGPSDTFNWTSSDSSIVISGNNTTKTFDLTVASGIFPTASFTTINCPDGDPVVADSISDTLTITSNGGLEISGVAASDTINFLVTANLAFVLTNGNQTQTNIIFTDEGPGVLFQTGTVGTGLRYDGGELFIEDVNSNTTFSIYAQVTNILEELRITTLGFIKFDLGTTDIHFIKSGSDLFIDVVGAGSPLVRTEATIRFDSATKAEFRDTALTIHSSVDGQLDFAADVKALITSPIFETSANLKVGTTTTLNSLTYTWPASQGASQFLQTNGSGTLSWTTISTPTWAQVLSAGNSSSGNNALMTTSDELRLRDTSTRLYSNAANEVTLEATTKTIVGVAGDIELGDSTLRKIFPNTNLAMDLGDSTHRFNDAWIDDIFIGAGASTSNASVGGTLSVNTTSVGNVGTGEDDLMTYSLPANTLSTNGYHIEIIAWGRFASNANTKRLKGYFGSTALLDSAGLAVNNADWSYYATVTRTGAATQTGNANINTSSSLLTAYADVTTPTETLSGAVTVKMTGEGTADNDIIQDGMIIRFFPI